MRLTTPALLRARIRAFMSDANGVAAVEFAYLVPLLMLITFGTFEIARALFVHKRFQRATAMVGDLIAREKFIGSTSSDANAALTGIMISGQHVMSPYSADPFKLAVTQLRASATDAKKTKVEWSWSYNSMPTTGCGSQKSMPADDMVTKGNAVILIESSYAYKPLLTDIIPGLVGSMNWSDTMTFAPRYGSVFYGQETQNTKCPPGSG